MKVGVVIPVFNRAVYLRQTLASVAATRHPFILYLVDDASREPATIQVFNEFTIAGGEVIKKFNPVNQNMFSCLRQGWKHLADMGCDVLTNLDSDAIVKPDWLDVLLGLHVRFKDRIVAGFNTERHLIRKTFEDYHLKDTVGGINLLFGKDLHRTVEACLVDEQWDWRLCKRMQYLGKPIVVSRPSVVQHIGQYGLHSQGECFDFAHDFDNEHAPGEVAARDTLLAESGKIEEAIEAGDYGCCRCGAETHTGLSWSLLSLGKPLKAIEHLRQLIRLRAGHGNALKLPVSAMQSTSDMKEAAASNPQAGLNGASAAVRRTPSPAAIDFRGKSIVLVGNRRPEVDVSDRIEAYDFVFRFSYMTFIRTGLIGRRTDGIHIEATDRYQDSVAKGPNKFCNANWLANVRLVTMRRMWFSMNVLEALRVADRECLLIDDSLSAHITRPTSGYNLILNVLHHPFFRGSKLGICCFTTDEAEVSEDLHWHQSSLSQERREINALIRAGIIHQLDRT